MGTDPARPRSSRANCRQAEFDERECQPWQRPAPSDPLGITKASLQTRSFISRPPSGDHRVLTSSVQGKDKLVSLKENVIVGR